MFITIKLYYMMDKNKNSILNIGSVAFDSLEIQGQEYDKIIGGSSTYFSLAASLFSEVYISAVVGKDFPKEMINVFKDKKINIDNLIIESGDTFHWGGKYSDDLNSRETKFTNLGVFESFSPKIKNADQFNGYLYLGNIQPSLQLSIIDQVKNSKKVIADTMNLWIDISNDTLWEVIKKTNIFLLNDEEAMQLTNLNILKEAANKLLLSGPEYVIIKQGEKGSTIFSKNLEISVPSNRKIVAKDPTGAGDSFAGGMVGYLAEKGSDNILESVIQATALASFTVSDIGIKGLLKANRNLVNNIAEKIKKEMEIYND